MARGHILDSHTFALYRLDENYLYAKDATTNGFDLNPTSYSGMPVPSLVRDAGKARYFDGTYSISGAGGATWASIFAGEHTVELWARVGDTGSSNVRFFEFYDVGGTSASNRFRFGLRSSPWVMTVAWDHDTETTMQDYSSALSGDPTLRTAHYAYRKKQVSSNWQIDYFVNGALLHSSSPIASNYSGGNLCSFYIGGASAEYFFGRMDDIRISNIARSDVEIQSSYLRGSTEPPVIVES